MLVLAEKEKTKPVCPTFLCHAKPRRAAECCKCFFWSAAVSTCLRAMPLSGLTGSAAEKTVLQQCLYQDSYAKITAFLSSELVVKKKLSKKDSFLRGALLKIKQSFSTIALYTEAQHVRHGCFGLQVH